MAEAPAPPADGPPPTASPPTASPPATAAAAPDAPAAADDAGGAAGDGRYTVQLGAFRDEGNARRFLGALDARGIGSRLVRLPDGTGRPWHAVWYGAYPDRAAARSAARALGDLSFLIVPMDEGDATQP
jgi:septal ring-binding cell division protein DamX